MSVARAAFRSSFCSVSPPVPGALGFGVVHSEHVVSNCLKAAGGSVCQLEPLCELGGELSFLFADEHLGVIPQGGSSADQSLRIVMFCMSCVQHLLCVCGDCRPELSPSRHFDAASDYRRCSVSSVLS